MKTVDEILSQCPRYETPNGNDALSYDSVLMAMRELALKSYDEGFKYAVEIIRIKPTGKQVLSVEQFINTVFPKD